LACRLVNKYNTFENTVISLPNIIGDDIKQTFETMELLNKRLLTQAGIVWAASIPAVVVGIDKKDTLVTNNISFF